MRPSIGRYIGHKPYRGDYYRGAKRENELVNPKYHFEEIKITPRPVGQFKKQAIKNEGRGQRPHFAHKSMEGKRR